MSRAKMTNRPEGRKQMKHWIMIGATVIVALVVYDLLVKKGLAKVGVSTFEEGWEGNYEKIAA